jgi:exopolysaccharide production protein ExoQ
MATAVARNPTARASAVLAERVAGWLPIVILAYPLIVWPLIFGVAESARGVMDTPTQLQEANPFNRVFFPVVFLVALTIMLVVPAWRLRPLGSAALILLTIYLAWAAASVAWALEPGTALRRLVAQACLVGGLVLSVFAARDGEALIGRIFGLVGLAAILNAVVVAAGPPGPLGYEGIYTQKNTLGSAGALMMFLALYALFGGRVGMRLIGLVVLVVALVLMVASQSKTSLGVALVAPGGRCGWLDPGAGCCRSVRCAVVRSAVAAPGPGSSPGGRGCSGSGLPKSWRR